MLAVSERDGIQIVQMRHGPVNALDAEFLEAIADRFEAPTQARAVVLTGTGRAFSAGADLKRVIAGEDDYAARGLAALSRAFLALFTFPKPLVAAVNGHAIAGGCVISCACDRRVMARGSGRIGLAELAVGVPFPLAAFEIARACVGTARMAEIALQAEVYPPEEALARGLIDEIVEPDDLIARAVEVGQRLASVPTATYAHTKRQLRRPILERIATQAPFDDREAIGIWASGEVRAKIRATLDALGS